MNPQSDFFLASNKKKRPTTNQMGLGPSQHPLPTLQAPLINLLTIKKWPFLKWVFYLVACVDPSCLRGLDWGSEGCRLQDWGLLVQASLALVLLFTQGLPIANGSPQSWLTDFHCCSPVSPQIQKLHLPSHLPKLKSPPWWGPSNSAG